MTDTWGPVAGMDPGSAEESGAQPDAQSSAPEPWDVAGPVLAEVFVVCLRDGGIVLTGPCGAAPWLLETDGSEHPMTAVARIVRDVIGEPRVVHSTSWRRDHDAVMLSFVVVIDLEQVGSMLTAPVARSNLARGDASAAPTRIGFEDVVEHGLRHLAWLVVDDPAVAAALGAHWRVALADYVPEPFRALA